MKYTTIVFLLLLSQKIHSLFIGTATSSYQIEGWNKGESIWDKFVNDRHLQPVGNATNHFKLYKKDIQLMKDLGFSDYRFSISWTRIMPYHWNEIDQEGVQFYHNVIHECTRQNITPWVTIYHWDLPNYIENSWLNPSIVDLFFEYSLFLFQEYGDQVNHWMTINEPLTTSSQGYGNICNFAPGICSEENMYTSGHLQLLAHAKVGSYYRNKYPEGNISLVINTNWFEPIDPDANYHAQNYMDSSFGWFINPLFTGEYPSVIQSKCPTFSENEKTMLKNSFSFLAINHYTTYLVDANGQTSTSSDWTRGASPWLFDAPIGMNRILHYIHNKYTSDIPIIITECGFSQKHDGVLDLDRVHYYVGYIRELLRAKDEGVTNIQGFFAWSLLDNFEWASGYSEKFGIVYVDQDYQRKVKASAKFLSEINQYFKY